ncbi:hypothetical protein NQZ68_029236 [Dissostichus eleginoides]|nr:hypothetical protein NQZ68_029236 [Dissostichus eleginoides]
MPSWQRILTDETVGEQSLELTSSPTVPICKKGRGYCQKPSEARAKPLLSQRKRVSESLGSCGELDLLDCLYPVLGQRQRWDVGGNPKEPERDSVKTKAPSQYSLRCRALREKCPFTQRPEIDVCVSPVEEAVMLHLTDGAMEEEEEMENRRSAALFPANAGNEEIGSHQNMQALSSRAHLSKRGLSGD